MSENNSLIEKS